MTMMAAAIQHAWPLPVWHGNNNNDGTTHLVPPPCQYGNVIEDVVWQYDEWV